MDDSEAQSLAQVRAILEGCKGSIRFAGQHRKEVYGFIERTLVRLVYMELARPDKGVVRSYMERMTGLSRAQITRLIGCYISTGRVTAVVYQRMKFRVIYTTVDVQLLAWVDKAHSNLSGHAVQRILEREFLIFGQAAYERLAGISVAHIYRIRCSAAYRKHNTTYQSTRPSVIPIGERRKPRPDGKPGYLRIDTVHQGDFDGAKGLYHINAVDEVLQWEIIVSAEVISERGLIPALEEIMRQFPFILSGFHSDNGSEFVNYNVAGMLHKLLIEQTRSRPYHSGDNGLVEAKNGAVIRKHIGFGHIPAHHAELISAFYRDFLNPYLNFHRPCAVPEIITLPNGKSRRVYKRWATPYELFGKIPDCQKFLRPGVSLEQLEQLAMAQTDTEAAAEMQTAKRQLMLRLGRGAA